jgi:alpha-L-fucosidase 2
MAIERADAVTLVLTAATSFRNFEDISADPAERCRAVMHQAAGRTFDDLLAAHLADYCRLFGRVTLDLGRTPGADLPIDQRLQRVQTSGLDGDPALVALYFQYGRYLLIASSRPGGQPANLQGLWNESLNPPWESKWTTNINLEMNYWPAEVTNLTECNGPLFDLIDDLTVTGHRTARAYYGCDGWVLHHNTDLWRATAPCNNIEGVWPTGGAWLCDHLWEHYLFTRDRDFLARRAYPVMKAAAQFFVEDLVRDPKTGWLVSTPSFSPEQGALTIGPTMDHQLIRALMAHTVQAAGTLGIDHAFAAKLADVCRQIAPNQIGHHGQLQEWLQDIDRPDNDHRHMSPLWALYPGSDLTPADPKMFAAAKKLLTWRGDGSTGWGYAWRIGLWARVYDGAFAYRQLSGLLRQKTLPNLFDLCGPFQIDGNFGGTAGIAELLLQSHLTVPGTAGTPEIDLLPARPTAWPDGTVTGLCARGGFEVDLAWHHGALTRAAIRSKSGLPCRIHYDDRTVDLSTQPGKQYLFDGQLRPVP